MKQRRSLVSLFVALCLLASLIPTAAFATGATGTATVSINGTQLTDNKPVQCGQGTATFDSQEKTLILDNATIEGGQNQPIQINGNNTADLTIKLKGTNKITALKGSGRQSFYAATVNITIEGSEKDILILESDIDALQLDDGDLTIDGCTLKATSEAENGAGINVGGMNFPGALTIKNKANVTVNSPSPALMGDGGINISNSTVEAASEIANRGALTIYTPESLAIDNSSYVKATNSGSKANAIYSGGTIDINNSRVEAVTTSEDAPRAIYGAGNIAITNSSNVTAVSNGKRGIFTSKNMTVEDSTVTAAGTTDEGMVVKDTLTVNNSKLTASGSPNAIKPGISTKKLAITSADVTAKGGMKINDPSDTNNAFILTPAQGKLIEVKAGTAYDDESAAQHFKVGAQSPYDTAVTFGAEALEKLAAYRYVHIKEHIHSGGTATCQTGAACADCGKTYGNVNSNNHLHKEVRGKKTVTASQDGYTGDTYCADCNTLLERGKVIPAAKTAKLAAPTKVKVSPSYDRIKLSWKKVKGANGYQVYRAVKKNGKYKKVKTTKTASWTNKKLKTGKTYYYKARAYRVVKGKKVYSKFSPVQKIRAK